MHVTTDIKPAKHLIYILFRITDCRLNCLYQSHSKCIFDSNNTIFHVGESFTVYDIEYDQNEDVLLLSCGSNGVLAYDWNDDSGSVPMFIGQFTTSYAYTAKMYGSNTLIVGTESGLELFNIGD